MTWDEYEELAKKMTSGGRQRKGIRNTQPYLAGCWCPTGPYRMAKEHPYEWDYGFLKPYYEQALRMQDEGVVQSYANLKTGSIHYISVF